MSGFEGLDDDHGTAAGRAGISQYWRLIGIGINLTGFALCWLDVEQLTQLGQVVIDRIKAQNSARPQFKSFTLAASGPFGNLKGLTLDFLNDR